MLLVACAAHDQSISISFAGLAVWLVLFLFFCATHSLRLSGASIYGESCAGTCSGRFLACGWWFWSSSRILRHTVECLRHCFWKIGSLSSGWCSWISKCLEARQRPCLPLKSELGSLLLHLIHTYIHLRSQVGKVINLIYHFPIYHDGFIGSATHSQMPCLLNIDFQA